MQIAVLGSGVAGMAAARALVRAGVWPCLIAPEETVRARGETLSPRALPFLEKLGWSDLLDDTNAVAGEGRFSIWGSAHLRRGMEEERGLHLDRSALEAAMARTLNGHVERIATSVQVLEHHAAGVQLILENGVQRPFVAVVDCTGRTALSSGAVAERRRLDKLVATYAILPVPDDVQTIMATLVEAVEIGWWYAAPMPGQRMMVGLFSDSDLLPAHLARDGTLWARMAQGTSAIGPRLESLGLMEDMATHIPQMAPASTTCATHLLEGRIVRAGDAAAALDPLGANGLATALWSGMQAANASIALVQGDDAPARAYEQAYLEGIYRHLSTQQQLYASEPRFAAAPFWARRRVSAHHFTGG